MEGLVIVRTFARTLLVVFCSLLPLMHGCGNKVLRNALPMEHAAEMPRIDGFPQVRFWADGTDPAFMRRVVDLARQYQVSFPDHNTDENRRTMLFLSGGGADGAFGAGLLKGWSEKGGRPAFRIVTGVSTGALIAPFAFLGSEYDDFLEHMYTSMSASRIYLLKGLFSILGSDSISDTGPLRRVIEESITPQVLADVAREYGKGRMLFIQTTNLDAQRPVLWDMGLIAKVGGKTGLRLFQQVMLASSSIPVIFPPVYFKSRAVGKAYDEMHVDGGTSSQIFIYGPMIRPEEINEAIGHSLKVQPHKVYLIINNRLQVEYDPVRPKLADISASSISSLIRSQAMGAVYTLYAYCRRDGFDFNLAHIPAKNYPEREDEFDPQAMRVLFETGRNMARQNGFWEKTPPGYVED
jgi:hypothetical protein